MREKETREREDLPQVGGLRSPDSQMPCGSLIQKGHPWQQRLNLSEACGSGRRGVHAKSPQPQFTLQACERQGSRVNGIYAIFCALFATFAKSEMVSK